jgi:hypothetical protein
MKDKLLNSIRLAISSQGATDVEVDDADSLLAEITGTTNKMDDVVGNESIDDDDVDSEEGIVEVVASTNGNSSDPLHHDPQFSAATSEPDLHSIPHIQTPPNLTVNQFTVTTPLESDTCVSTSINPDTLNNDSKGGGGIKNAE